MSLWHHSLLFRSVKPRKISGLALIFVVFMTAALGSTAFGQEYTDIRTLGTSNAVFKPGPQTRADLQRMFSDHRADYEKVLRDTNWPGNPDDLFNAVANGDFSEAQYPVGHTFEWMAVRKRGVVQATGRIRWAGRNPFEAFEIRFESNGQEHRFLIPKACGNLSLIQMRDAGPPALTAIPRVNVQSPNQCTSTNVTVDVTIPGMPEGASLEVTLTRPSGQRETLNPSRAGGGYRWEGQLADAGAYTFSATVTRGSERTQTVTERLNLQPCEPTCSLELTRPPADPTPRAGRSTLGIDVCSSAARAGSLTSKKVSIYHTPIDGTEQLLETLSLDAECSASYVMPEYGGYRLEGTVVDDRNMESTCQESYTLLKPEGKYGPFFTLFAGNERRWRPGIEGAAEVDGFENDVSAALLGGTIGYMWPVAGGGAGVFTQFGGAANLKDGENSSLFADVGIDKMWESGFLGGGVGIWDINNSDTRDGTIFVHGGFNINPKLQFYLEGRLFMDMLDMIDNNYVYMGGIRYFFKN
ncbi:MAG: hypothetical protein BMS9Abin37_2520 [Acidobacteriota bacterium]|nr:MAG: hypothetical protein BMS9Abin37_2520 [Acidobacteriota bacterium]